MGIDKRRFKVQSIKAGYSGAKAHRRPHANLRKTPYFGCNSEPKAELKTATPPILLTCPDGDGVRRPQDLFAIQPEWLHKAQPHLCYRIPSRQDTAANHVSSRFGLRVLAATSRPYSAGAHQSRIFERSTRCTMKPYKRTRRRGNTRQKKTADFRVTFPRSKPDLEAFSRDADLTSTYSSPLTYRDARIATPLQRR